MNNYVINLKEHCKSFPNTGNDTFVGLKITSSEITINFPLGYNISSSNEDIKDDIRTLLQTLIFCNPSKEGFLENKSSLDNNMIVNFPINSILTILQYYFSHNCEYYSLKTYTSKKNASGKIDWKKTIRLHKPIVQNKSIFYIDVITKHLENNFSNLITEINKYCVYRSYQILGWLFPKMNIQKPSIAFSKTIFLSALNSKLITTNIDSDKLLISSMINLINFFERKPKIGSLICGTTSFEFTWEKMVKVMFGNCNIEDYAPKAKWDMKLPFPKKFTASNLIPDSIMKINNDYCVLDAKYYKYGVMPSLGNKGLPQSSDINKQITYGQNVASMRRIEDGSNVYNAFLMPFNSKSDFFHTRDNILFIGCAYGSWSHDRETYSKIKAILVDTKFLMENFLKSSPSYKIALYNEIKKI